jgi:hypothetical protein
VVFPELALAKPVAPLPTSSGDKALRLGMLRAIACGIEKLLARRAPLGADFRDRRIGNFAQRCVPRVMRVLVRIVGFGVVAAEQSPARLLAQVRIRRVQRVAVKEERVPLPHLAIDVFQALHRRRDAFGIGTGLLAELAMLDAAHQVRAAQQLQATVLARRRIERNEHARHRRKQTAVVVPIAVILMPLPRAADLGFLGAQLRMVVIDFIAQELFHRVDDPLRARDHAVDVVAGIVPERQIGAAPFGIGDGHRVGAHGLIVARRREQQLDLGRGEQIFDKQITIALEGRYLVSGQSWAGHAGVP